MYVNNFLCSKCEEWFDESRIGDTDNNGGWICVDCIEGDTDRDIIQYS